MPIMYGGYVERNGQGYDPFGGCSLSVVWNVVSPSFLIIVVQVLRSALMTILCILGHPLCHSTPRT